MFNDNYEGEDTDSEGSVLLSGLPTVAEICTPDELENGYESSNWDSD